MNAVINGLAAFVAWLCEMFEVKAETIADGRRGNQPPPSGGIGAS